MPCPLQTNQTRRLQMTPKGGAQQFRVKNQKQNLSPTFCAGTVQVMKISWFASQNATHFRVHANQFHMPAHVGANHLFAVYHIHVLPNERNSRTPLTSLAVWIWTEFQSESSTYLPICSGELMFHSPNDNLTAWAVDRACITAAIPQLTTGQNVSRPTRAATCDVDKLIWQGWGRGMQFISSLDSVLGPVILLLPVFCCVVSIHNSVVINSCLYNCKRFDVCFGFANQFFLIANQSEIVEQNCYSFSKVYFHHCTVHTDRCQRVFLSRLAYSATTIFTPVGL